MSLLPYERFTIKTHLHADEAAIRLGSAIEPTRDFREWNSAHKPYQGSVEANRFSITRIIHSRRTTFRPVINGEITSETDGCSIYLTMRPDGPSVGFIASWIGFLGFFFLAALALVRQAFLSNNLFPAGGLMTAAYLGGMLIFGYAFMLGAFQVEVDRSKEFLQEIFGDTFSKPGGQ